MKLLCQSYLSLENEKLSHWRWLAFKALPEWSVGKKVTERVVDLDLDRLRETHQKFIFNPEVAFVSK